MPGGRGGVSRAGSESKSTKEKAIKRTLPSTGHEPAVADGDLDTRTDDAGFGVRDGVVGALGSRQCQLRLQKSMLGERKHTSST